MLRFFLAMLVLSAVLAGMQYVVKEPPSLRFERDEPATVEAPPMRPHSPSPSPSPTVEIRMVPVTREVIRRDCSGRAYVGREIEYQPVRVVRCP